MTSTSETVAAWITALATVVAVLAAIYAGHYAKRAHDIEVRRDEDREEDRRQAQAELVAAWCPVFDYRPAVPGSVTSVSGGTFIKQGRRLPTWTYFLRNASSVPVYDVVLHFRQGAEGLGTDALDTLPPDSEPLTREVPSHIANTARLGAHEHGEVIRVLVSFRDAAGRRWTRRWNGVLSLDEEGQD
ncbi:hypothetical protein [Nocardioides sp. Soil796]|uniref:hypothetical protein n=1 Tax=Nocardioides sp. Soil796 TaxID=1736412 RepID=UPI0012E36B97|nr:hypothetical protein [Nocardioides sp. Soil796]